MVQKATNTTYPPPPPPPPAMIVRNRLEPRPRKNQFERSMKAEVRDPLWMLTRQWQFGEFKGEDAGSPVFSKAHLLTSRINRYSGLAGNTTPAPDAIPYTDDVPLETRVERETIQIDTRMQLQIGQHWFKLLNHYGQQYNTGTPAPSVPYVTGMYEDLYLRAYPVTAPQVPAASSNSFIAAAQVASNEKLYGLLSAAAGRVMDGGLFHAHQLSSTAVKAQNVTYTLPDSTLLSVHTDHKAFVQTAAAELMAWFRRLHPQAIAAEKESWNPSRLEYKFGCTVPNAKTTGHTVLKAEEYYHGTLDWYSFDIDHSRPVDEEFLVKANTHVNEQVVENHNLTLIPAPLKYDGMPSPRYWEFEDARVDLGNIDANTTDTAKILMSEFALVYSGDWFIIPFTLPAGSMCDINDLTVTDVFGVRTTVEAAGKGEDAHTAGWRMFTLTTINDADGSQADTRLFLPPVVSKQLESEPVESINFLRDEMANMVWAVENKVPNGLGGGVEGFEAANDLAKFITSLNPGSVNTVTELPNNAEIKYILGNTVPENWIPFVPVQIGNTQKEIQLQRASMPRVIENRTGLPPSINVVRPRGVILNETPAPYYVYEEEVPRSGAIVSRAWQRTRWTNGSIVTWLGRKKQTGRGEGSSGLMYDQVVPKE